MNRRTRGRCHTGSGLLRNLGAFQRIPASFLLRNLLLRLRPTKLIDDRHPVVLRCDVNDQFLNSSRSTAENVCLPA